MNPLLELYRHKSWATLRLIEHCQGLDGENLDATIPGTYGTIRDTLRHVVESEEGYFRLLTGERVSEPLPDGPVPMDELAERIRRLGPRWEALAAQDTDLGNREVNTSDGWLLPGAVPMAQAIHHAGDHRTHVLSILGSRGLEIPALDVWGYAESASQMLLNPSKKFGATVHTSRGDFTIVLDDPKIAPLAVTRFVYLAQDNFYQGLAFNRVVPGFVVHAGDPAGHETGGPTPAPGDESSPPTWPRGTVLMASSRAGDIGSELILALGDVSFREAGDTYHHLGQVTAGIETVGRIEPGDTMRSIDITVS